ncbi:hypothetical protein L8R84_27890 [Vibrio splendidus]|uniref:hypothetical protein n=1 Tax=Vibrio splendidus TaxID=29497 RepID=UPI0024692A65|nr:hypothetical protein [Vibrio splendidus]MDH5939891.1 hypothetical protein [Vibrio splendidus]
MRDTQIPQKTKKTYARPFIKKRVNSLMLATSSVLDGSDLKLTKLGQKLEINTTVKHTIRRIDTLLGNHQK